MTTAIRLALPLVLSVSAARGVRAATFVVDSTLDAVDAFPGDAACATAAAECTLRAAIGEANALPGPDIVTLPAGIFELAIAGVGEDANATGDLDVTDELAIRGAGQDATVISAAQLDRVLDVAATILSVDDLTLERGWLMPGMPGGGGGLRTLGSTVSLRHVTVQDCLADEAPGLETGPGGGIYSDGGLFAEDIIVRGNKAGQRGAGGIKAYQITLRRSLIECNTAGILEDPTPAYGGGGEMGGSVRECIFRWNVAEEAGGLSFAGGLLADSTIEGNIAVPVGRQVDGGRCAGILTGSSQFENVTVTGNVALGGAGRSGPSAVGGVCIAQNYNSTFSHVTIADNTADYIGGMASKGLNMVSVSNSVISGNTGLNGNDTNGSIQLHGPTLIGDTSSPPGGDPSFLIVSADARLGPLADNGGPTRTHALGLGSRALDAADDLRCTHEDGSPMMADQRGAVRPFDADGDGVARCDLGAYEAQITCVGPDTDGDRVSDACDCAPSDPNEWDVPSEPLLWVSRVGALQPRLRWSNVARFASNAMLFDIASDEIAAMHAARAATATCTARAQPDTAFDEPRDLQALSVYYLVRPAGSCSVATGSPGWGKDSLGASRPTCP